MHQFAPLTSVISTLCPEKSTSSPESQRNTGQNHPARQFKSTVVFIQIELLTVSFPIDGALVEGHDVLRQGARLVTEDVFDLAQLLIEHGGPRLGRSVILGVIHLPVPVDIEAAPQTDDLHTDIDTHRGALCV